MPLTLDDEIRENKPKTGKAGTQVTTVEAPHLQPHMKRLHANPPPISQKKTDNIAPSPQDPWKLLEALNL